MARYKVDEKSGRDPREIAGLIREERGIPKRNLGKLLNQRGITPAEFGRSVGVSNISGMISGARRMSNTAVLKVASALGVSPLYVLDLTDEVMPSPHSVDAYEEAREQLASLIVNVYSNPGAHIPDALKSNMGWEGAYGDVPRVRYRDSVMSFSVNDAVWTMAIAANEVVNVKGDYRDLKELAQDLENLYPRTVTAMLAMAPIETT